MNGVCGDNRFEIINKVKKRLLEATNIEQSPKELEVLDNLLFRLWQCGYFDYIETFEKEEMTFKEWYKKSDCELTGVSIGIARCIFQAGAKAMQEDKQSLAKRIYELQSDLSREKSKNEELIKKVESYNKANEWHYVKDEDLPNTEFSRVDVTIAYIDAYGNSCIRDCCFDGDNFIYWDDRKPIGWKKVDIFGKIYAWKYPEKFPKFPKFPKEIE